MALDKAASGVFFPTSLTFDFCFLEVLRRPKRVMRSFSPICPLFCYICEFWITQTQLYVAVRSNAKPLRRCYQQPSSQFKEDTLFHPNYQLLTIFQVCIKLFLNHTNALAITVSYCYTHTDIKKHACFCSLSLGSTEYIVMASRRWRIFAASICQLNDHFQNFSEDNRNFRNRNLPIMFGVG